MKSEKILFYFVCLIPILTFLLTLSLHLINLPFYDDYDTIFRYIKEVHFDNSKTAQNLFTKLLVPHNEHRIFTSRVTVLVYYYFFGIINFKHLILFQNVFLCLTFLFVLKIVKETKLAHPYWIIILIVFSLFNLSFWASSFFFSGGIQHYTSFLFAFICLYTLNKAPQITYFQWAAALLCGFIATFSFGCGILVMPIGAFLLWVKEQKRSAIAWGVCSLLFILIYINGPEGAAPPRPPFNLFSFLKFFFTFLGSPFYINAKEPNVVWTNTLICMTIGLFVFGFWIYLFFSGYYKKNTLLYCLLSFCIATGILLAYSRFQYNAGGGVVDRYMFFSRCLFVWILIIVASTGEIKKSVLKVITVCYLGIWGMLTINTIPKINSSKTMLANLILGWKEGKIDYLIPQYPTTSYSEILSWAIENNIYHLPLEIEIQQFKTGHCNQSNPFQKHSK